MRVAGMALAIWLRIVFVSGTETALSKTRGAATAVSDTASEAVGKKVADACSRYDRRCVDRPGRLSRLQLQYLDHGDRPDQRPTYTFTVSATYAARRGRYFLWQPGQRAARGRTLRTPKAGRRRAHESLTGRSSRSGRVRRQGLEPRTRGLREDRLAALGLLPAHTAPPCARNAHNALSTRCRPFHEPFHGVRVLPV
jgi:hypothetical protein